MIKNIVFSGCGLKCWAYIGTIRALSEYPVHQIQHVVGVSAGSLFGLLFLLGMKWDFLLDFFINIDFKELIDIDIDNILIQQSIFAGVKFTQLIKELISYKIDPECTFKDLRYFTGIKMTIGAINITKSCLEYFDHEKTPDVKLVDAIIASCSIPIIFPPYKIKECFYYDGGFINNCPSDIVDEVDTIAFNFTLLTTDNQFSFKFFDLLNTLIKIINKTNSIRNDNVYDVLDDSFMNQAFNFNQNKDDIFNIYMHGYINSKNIIFKNYVALPSPVQ